MLCRCVARRCVGGKAPVFSRLGIPELLKGGVTIEIDDDKIGTAGVLSLTVPIKEVGRSPAVARLHPPE